MIRQLLYVCTLFLMTTGLACSATTTPLMPIKVALLDNPNFEVGQNWGIGQYQSAYLNGVRAAVSYAKTRGISLQFKPFFYDSPPLAVLDQLPSLKAWQPDFVIGPHFSNQFFILKNDLKNLLVLSSYASDNDIAQLPKNFQTASILDHYFAVNMLHFFKHYHPNANIINIVEVDCKDCVDLTKEFNQLYQHNFPKAQIYTTYYLSDNLLHLNVKKLLANYRPGDMIVLQPSNFEASLAVENQLAHAKPKQTMHFLSALDNWGIAEKLFANETPPNAIVYRLFQNYKSVQDNAYEIFFKNYADQNGLASNLVSFVVYISLRSVIDAFKRFAPKGAVANPQNILQAYLQARQKFPSWYKPKNFTLGRLSAEGYKQIALIPIDYGDGKAKQVHAVA